MTRLDALVGAGVGVAAVLVVYIAFVAHEFVNAGHSGAAVGVGVFTTVLGRPLFVVAAMTAFVLAFLRVVR